MLVRLGRIVTVGHFSKAMLVIEKEAMFLPANLFSAAILSLTRSLVSVDFVDYSIDLATAMSNAGYIPMDASAGVTWQRHQKKLVNAMIGNKILGRAKQKERYLKVWRQIDSSLISVVDDVTKQWYGKGRFRSMPYSDLSELEQSIYNFSEYVLVWGLTEKLVYNPIECRGWDKSDCDLAANLFCRLSSKARDLLVSEIEKQLIGVEQIKCSQW